MGKESVKALLQHNAKVYLAARNPERVNKAIEELKAATGKEPIFLQLDLSDLSAVRTAAEEFLACVSCPWSLRTWPADLRLARSPCCTCSSTMRTFGPSELTRGCMAHLSGQTAALWLARWSS